MTDTYEHNPGDHEDPLPGPTITIGLIGIALLVVSVLGVTTLLYQVTDQEYEKKVVDQRVNIGPPELEKLNSEQLARLAGPARRELRPENPAGQESLVIPIEDAMAKLVARMIRRIF